MPISETKVCQNCKASFEIDARDFEFYGKIDVPPPTFCPACRMQRRMMFRNERALYKGVCGMCEKNMITIFRPDGPYKVYCNECWWSDKWDAEEYGRGYDPNRNFFDQLHELWEEVPLMALVNTYTTLVNSDYVNHTGNLKNSYLVFDTDYGENLHYSTVANHCVDSMDLLFTESSELCYWDINCEKCFNTYFSEDCRDCHGVWFSKDLSGCSNCVGCIGLRNKSYHIFNEEYSKEEYEKKFKEMKLNTRSGLEAIKERAHEFWLRYPNKFLHGTMNLNSTGDYLHENKNTRDSYMCRGVEEGRYCMRISIASSKEVYDYFEWGNGVEKIYECITVGEGCNNIKFCTFCAFSNSLNVEYSTQVLSCADVFGCVGMRKKKFAILNKVYSEDEYKKLRSKIIADMTDNPYIDQKGRTWKYGEFFPYDLSPFAYNESTAIQYFDLSDDQAKEKGFRWYERPAPNYEITKKAGDIPDAIDTVPDEITDDIIECGDCGRPYRITKAELVLLRRFEIPAPLECPDCRHMKRMRRINSPKLYSRSCQCAGEKSDPPSRTGIKNKELGIKEFATDIETNQQPTTDNLQQGTEDIDNKESKTRGTYTNTSKNHPDHAPDEHCPNEFQTSYSPERLEIIYCEQCYQAEVV